MLPGRPSHVKREDVFVTAKLWNDHHRRVEDAMAASLNVDCFRFFLINFSVWSPGCHCPGGGCHGRQPEGEVFTVNFHPTSLSVLLQFLAV